MNVLSHGRKTQDLVCKGFIVVSRRFRPTKLSLQLILIEQYKLNKS